MIFDTIAAISTPHGEGGIGIIRISGSESIDILKKIFKSKKDIQKIKSHTINYGFIIDDEKVIDEVLVTFMQGPKTYTKEDIIEINCHGGFLITQKILEIVLKNGARHAQKGEFTKRAFLNGRIDLSQAESIIDIIKGKTEKGIEISLNHLRGDIRNLVLSLKEKLINVAAHVNVVIDYPEEGIEEPLPVELKNDLIDVKDICINLLKSYEKGKKIKNGISTAIVGKPNVGKSSILNALLKEERAIVTHIPGTTRDIIEEVININGIPLVISDTAGIRKSENIVENIGVDRTIKSIDKSSLVLFVIDNSSKNIDEDIKIYESIKNKNVIGIINKIDLENEIDISRFDNIKKWIKISAKQNNGIEEMEKEIYNYITNKDINDSDDNIILTNIRQKTAIEKTKKSIDNILETLDSDMPLDLISIDLKEAIDYLSEVTGEISSEDILDHVFSNFCVGK